MQRVVVPAIALLLALSGCSLLPQPDPTFPPPPSAGSCLDSRDGRLIDLASVVPCTEQHLFDVVGSVTWDGMDAAIGDGKGEGAEIAYNVIAQGSNEEYESAMFDACDQLNREALGIAGVSVNGVDAASMDLAVMGAITDFSLAAPEFFDAGDHSTTCVVSWTDVDNAERTVAYPAGITFADYADAAFPSDQHVCATSVDGENAFLDCAEAHESQQLLSFRGIDVVGAEWIATVNPDGLVVPDYSVPDAVCAQLVAQAFTGLPVGGWLVWANIYSTSSGWSDFDGTVDPTAGYYFSCDLNAPDDASLIVGDAFSGTATIAAR